MKDKNVLTAIIVLFLLSITLSSFSPLSLISPLIFTTALFTPFKNLKKSLGVVGFLSAAIFSFPESSNPSGSPVLSLITGGLGILIPSIYLLSYSFSEGVELPWVLKETALFKTYTLVALSITTYILILDLTSIGIMTESLPVGRIYLIGAVTLLTAGMFLKPISSVSRQG